jgi:hypothetical protein
MRRERLSPHPSIKRILAPLEALTVSDFLGGRTLFVSSIHVFGHQGGGLHLSWASVMLSSEALREAAVPELPDQTCVMRETVLQLNSSYLENELPSMADYDLERSKAF